MNAAGSNGATAHGVDRPATSLSGVVSLLGRVVAAAVVIAAGVGGWFGIERFDVALPGSGAVATAAATELPDLGEGLPEVRLQSPPQWRQFAITYTDTAQTNQFWVDLDSRNLRVESVAAEGGATAVEISGDSSYTRASLDADWVAHDTTETRNMASWLMTGIGPFVITDLVPPNTLGFTTLELEGTSRGERVYEVSVDAATLQSEHPLAHQRWADATRLVNDSTGIYRIRVREDGYIVRIDADASSVQWSGLNAGVSFLSPLAAPPTPPLPVATTSVPATPPGDLGDDTAVKPPAVPAPDATTAGG